MGQALREMKSCYKQVAIYNLRLIWHLPNINRLLYQLSYTPGVALRESHSRENLPTARFELTTFALSTRRLCQLGYVGFGAGDRICTRMFRFTRSAQLSATPAFEIGASCR